MVRVRFLKNLYNWTLSWAASKYAGWGLFLVAFIESSFFPIPPDALLIPLVLGDEKKWFYFASVCTAGSVLGGLFGYLIGLVAMDTVGQLIFTSLNLQESVESFGRMYASYGNWIVLIAGFTPIPYKVITILSGAMKLDLAVFIIYSLIGRGGRFFLVSALLRIFGSPLRKFIDKYFDLLSVLFVLLLIGGFVALRFL
ncbi:MAG: DedA family protein [Deltaproteobacteria bacterium]|nr:DedA family protein [Deltaproteobacteria bacterium]